MAVRKRVIVSGHVQGVFFRDTCRREAAARGVGGSARNLSDGTVEVILEGDLGAVDEMVDWCRGGPPHAHVAAIDVSDETPMGETDFRIA